MAAFRAFRDSDLLLRAALWARRSMHMAQINGRHFQRRDFRLGQTAFAGVLPSSVADMGAL
jgi:hypothetical protein